MKAIFINEIKRDREGSGLGAIGIGRASILETYIKLNRRWPDFFNENAKKLSEVFKEMNDVSNIQKTKDKLANYKEVFEEYSDESLENFIAVNIYNGNDPDPWFSETDELSFDMGINFDEAYEMFNDEMDNGRSVIFSSKFEYVNKKKIGFIYVNVAEKHDNIFHFIFVKYK